MSHQRVNTVLWAGSTSAQSLYRLKFQKLIHNVFGFFVYRIIVWWVATDSQDPGFFGTKPIHSDSQRGVTQHAARISAHLRPTSLTQARLGSQWASLVTRIEENRQKNLSFVTLLSQTTFLLCLSLLSVWTCTRHHQKIMRHQSRSIEIKDNFIWGKDLQLWA